MSWAPVQKSCSVPMEPPVTLFWTATMAAMLDAEDVSSILVRMACDIAASPMMETTRTGANRANSMAPTPR